jgi:hypothetical protein
VLVEVLVLVLVLVLVQAQAQVQVQVLVLVLVQALVLRRPRPASGNWSCTRKRRRGRDCVRQCCPSGEWTRAASTSRISSVFCIINFLCCLSGHSLRVLHERPSRWLHSTTCTSHRLWKSC